MVIGPSQQPSQYSALWKKGRIKRCSHANLGHYRLRNLLQQLRDDCVAAEGYLRQESRTIFTRALSATVAIKVL